MVEGSSVSLRLMRETVLFDFLMSRELRSRLQRWYIPHNTANSQSIGYGLMPYRFLVYFIVLIVLSAYHTCCSTVCIVLTSPGAHPRPL